MGSPFTHLVRVSRGLCPVATIAALALSLSACGAAFTPRPDEPFAPARTAGVWRQSIDGGPSYFASKSRKSAWMDKHILLGAWLEQPQNAHDVAEDAAMGENIYWNLGGKVGVDRADYNVLRAGGMHVSAPDSTPRSGSETVSNDGSDEADLNYGPGWSGFYHPPGRAYWNKDDCVPAGSECGYTSARFYYDGNRTNVDPRQPNPGYPANTGLVVHQGYGKDVLFWLTAAQAAQFLKYSDVLSADTYWITDTDAHLPSQGGCALRPHDPTVCDRGNGAGLTSAQTHLPANYEFNVTALERLQRVNGRSKPVVVDVETGCPASGGSGAGQCATPPQTIAAAWHALIAGARGIIWFQHNFSGPCVTYGAFLEGSNPASPQYDCPQTPGVTLHDVVLAIDRFQREVRKLEGALLSPTVRGYVHANGDVSTTAKAHAGSCYVFAGSGRPAAPPPADQSVTFRLADKYNGKLTVLNENRTIKATAGSFRDMFADATSVHIYRLERSSCGV
jgi:hypothetical protein